MRALFKKQPESVSKREQACVYRWCCNSRLRDAHRKHFLSGAEPFRNRILVGYPRNTPTNSRSRRPSVANLVFTLYQAAWIGARRDMAKPDVARYWAK